MSTGSTPSVETPGSQQAWELQQQSRDHLVQMLDEVRRQQELVTVNRSRYLVLADRYGMSVAEIAELVNMSASGVRKAIRRAQSDPPFSEAS